MPAVARFYSPQSAPYRVGERAYLSEAARHHAGRVLRAVAGDPVLLFDGEGRAATGPIAFEGKDAWITVEKVETPLTESPVHLTLIQSMVNNDKADWIVEKAVEAGVAAIVFAPAARCITKLAGDKLEKRLARWQDIITGACEQCGRNVLPAVSAAPSLEKALASVTADVRWLMHPGEASAPVLGNAGNVRSAAFAVGPEGGFSEEEVALARSMGWQCAVLGPRVLRTETAGLAAAVFLNTRLGDLG